MRPKLVHEWAMGHAEARLLQTRLAPMVSQSDEIVGMPRLIAGVDISGAIKGEEALASVVVMSYPELELVEVRTAKKAPPDPLRPWPAHFAGNPRAPGCFRTLGNESAGD